MEDLIRIALSNAVAAIAMAGIVAILSPVLARRPAVVHALWTLVLLKLVTPPLFVQTIFGILGGIGADPENLMHMKRTADKLFGDDYRWSVLAAGRHQLPFTTMAAVMGGNVRVGLEDSLYIGKGKLAKSNAEQVRLIRSIIESLSLEVATPEEARAELALKGGDKVAF